MARPSEGLQPSPDSRQSPLDRVMAAHAFNQLCGMFLPPEARATSAAEIAGTSKLINTVSAYYGLSIRAAYEGIPDEQRREYIKRGLLEQELLDNDPERAENKFQVISNGYELNRPWFDGFIGQARRLKIDSEELRRKMEPEENHET